MLIFAGFFKGAIPYGMVLEFIELEEEN